ncbi:MAG: hypothetical protein NVSMB2_13230 [Chloroflexota bacterium]
MMAEDPLGAAIERSTGGGWVVRVPLRREDIQIEKRTVIAERLLIGLRQVPDVERVEAELRRERLRVEGDDVDATQPLEATTRLDRGDRRRMMAPAQDTLAGNGMEQEPLR